MKKFGEESNTVLIATPSVKINYESNRNSQFNIDFTDMSQKKLDSSPKNKKRFNSKLKKPSKFCVASHIVPKKKKETSQDKTPTNR